MMYPEKSAIFPSDSSLFIKMLESPINLQIIFNLTVYADLTFAQLSEKMGYPDKKVILESLNNLKQMGLVEEHLSDDMIHYKSSFVSYTQKEYEDYANFDEEQLREYLNEEFIFSYRTISWFKSIIGKLVHYICDFYINRLHNPALDTLHVKKELKYDTCVPRIGFVTKEEYELYRKRFIEFEQNMKEELMAKRKSLGIIKSPDIEYIITNLFIPIKKVIDHK